MCSDWTVLQNGLYCFDQKEETGYTICDENGFMKCYSNNNTKFFFLIVPMHTIFVANKEKVMR